MTQPPIAYDPANPLFGPVQCRMDTATATSPDGSARLGMVTIRTASTTVTVLLTPGQLRSWSDLLGALAGQLGGAGGGLAVATPADVITLGKPRR